MSKENDKELSIKQKITNRIKEFFIYFVVPILFTVFGFALAYLMEWVFK